MIQKGKKTSKPKKISRKRVAAQEAPKPAPEPVDYQARDDLHTLTRAEEVRGDSKRHKAARAEAKKQRDRLHKIAGGGPRDEAEMREYASKRRRHSPMEKVG